MKKLVLFCSVLMSLSVLFTACPEENGSSVASLELKPAEVSMISGEIRRLSVVAKDASGNTVEASLYELEWSSSNEVAAIVSDNGTVTAVDNGTAVITATVKGTEISATANVTVTNRIDNTVFDNASCLGYAKSEFYYPYDWTSSQDGSFHQDSLVRSYFYIFNSDMYYDAVNRNVVGTGGYGFFFKSNNIVDPARNTIYSLGEYLITENPSMRDTTVIVNGEEKQVSYAHPSQIKCGTFDTDAWIAFFTEAIVNDGSPSWKDYELYPDGDMEMMLWFEPGEDSDQMTYMNCGYVTGEGIVNITAKEGSKITDPLVIDYYEFHARIIDVENSYGLVTTPGDPEQGQDENETYFTVPLEMKPFIEKDFAYGERPAEEVAPKAMPIDRLQRNADFNKTINVVNVDKIKSFGLINNK